jgi:MIP family channel proteins
MSVFGEDDIAAYIAEFFGTFLFQVFGGGSSLGVYNGLVLSVLIFCTADISGGHLNPAVTFGLACGAEFPWLKCLLYIVVQLLGAVFGAMLNSGLFFEGKFIGDYGTNKYGLASNIHKSHGGVTGVLNHGSGCPVPFQAGTPLAADDGQIFGAELFGTMVLVLTVFQTAVAKPGFGRLAPIAIGFSIFIAVGSLGAISGGAFNPARYFGPALVFGCTIDKIWLYFFAEFFGGAFAGLLWRFVQHPWQNRKQERMRIEKMSQNEVEMANRKF